MKEFLQVQSSFVSKQTMLWEPIHQEFMFNRTLRLIAQLTIRFFLSVKIKMKIAILLDLNFNFIQ